MSTECVFRGQMQVVVKVLADASLLTKTFQIVSDGPRSAKRRKKNSRHFRGPGTYSIRLISDPQALGKLTRRPYVSGLPRGTRMSELSLGALVKFCVGRQASSAVFQSLLKQLDHKQEVSVDGVTDLLRTEARLDPLVVMYISTTVLGEQSTNIRLSVVLEKAPVATVENQELILNALIAQLRTQQALLLSSSELTEVIAALVLYLKYLTVQQGDNRPPLQSAARFVVMFGNSIPQDLVPAPLTPEQNEAIESFLAQMQDISPEESESLTLIADKIMRRSSTSARQSSVLTSLTSNSAAHTSFMKSNKLPKLLWLDYALSNWKTHSPNFLSSFDNFVKVKTNQNVLNELLTTAFEGYVIAQQEERTSPCFAKQWRLFLLKRVPLLITELKLKSTESSLVNALSLIMAKVSQTIKLQSGGNSASNYEDMFSSFPSTVTDIRHEFVKSCIAIQLLPKSAFSAILKEDAAVFGGELSTSDDVMDSLGLPMDIETTLKQTLVDINPEFTSLDDSGLLVFLQSVEKMEGTKQVEVSRAVLRTIEQFTSSEDNEHLCRLCLALSLSPDTLFAILFHVSPTAILKPIMNYLDKWPMSSEETNFQETHSAFGCTLLLLMLIVKEFNLSLEDLVALRESREGTSFCISYLANLGLSSGTDNTGDLEQHRSEVLNAWISALFDSGGISDDLMRMSNVHECFQIFPIIFQQAFIACKQNMIDMDTVKGGLEYFLQPSLLATIVGIISWSEGYLWKGDNVELLVELLKTLVSPSELSGESVHIHRVIVNIFGPGLYKSLSAIDSSPTDGIKIDPMFLSTLHQSIKEGRSLGFFEIDTANTFESIYEDYEKTSRISLMGAFNAQFQLLLTWGQSSVVPQYDHQFLANMVTFMGISAVIDYFVSQVTLAQQSNSKSSQAVLEISAFILTVPYVAFSAQSKKTFVSALKNGVVTDITSREHGLLRELTTRKAAYKEDTAEVFFTLYDKILEIAQTMHPLE